MAIAVYPSYLPGFLQSGYSLKTQPNMLRTVLSSNTGNKEPQYQTVRIQNGAISAALTWRSETETRWKISFTLDVATEPLPLADAGSGSVSVSDFETIAVWKKIEE